MFALQTDELKFALRTGVQIETERTAGDKVQFLLEYYHGHSPNGQFYEDAIEYWGLGLHFYF